MTPGEQVDVLEPRTIEEEILGQAGTLALSEAVIPLEVRLSMVEAVNQDIIWPKLGALAKQLGVGADKVKSLADDLMLEPKPDEAEGSNALLFPPCSAEVMRDELDWRKEYRELPPRIAVNKICEHLGRSKSWVKPRLEELGYTAIVKGSGRKTAHEYPKEALGALRTINMRVPLDNGWLTVGELFKNTGATNWPWVQRRLAESEFKPEYRRSIITGHIFNYYPPETLTYIEAEIIGRPEAGGDRLTAVTMAKILKRSEDWVTVRLESYIDTAEPGIADNHKTCDHYPRAVFEELKKESEELAALPEVGDGESLRFVRGVVGGMESTVRARLEALGITTDQRRNKAGRAGNYYPAGTAAMLKQLSE